jgi:hypothetical protein
VEKRFPFFGIAKIMVLLNFGDCHWKQHSNTVLTTTDQLFGLMPLSEISVENALPLRIGESRGFACFFERHWKRRATGVQWCIGQLFALTGFFFGSVENALPLGSAKAAVLLVFLSATGNGAPLGFSGASANYLF